MMKRNLTALCALILAVSGCASGGPRIIGGDGRINYAAGSGLGRQLGAREQESLYAVFLTAVERGASGEPQVWSAGSYSGSVTPGRYLVGNLKPDPRTLLPVEGRIDLNETYETELGLYVLTGRANLRAGPSTDAKVLDTLQSGTGVDVVGKVAGEPWMLVAVSGVIRGYVHQSLMIRAPGAELSLAGGPTRRAHFCREFKQSLTLFAQTDHWEGVACDRGEGWRLEPTSNPPITG